MLKCVKNETFVNCVTLILQENPSSLTTLHFIITFHLGEGVL